MVIVAKPIWGGMQSLGFRTLLGRKKQLIEVMNILLKMIQPKQYHKFILLWTLAATIECVLMNQKSQDVRTIV